MCDPISTDPKEFGCGVWFSIHILAKNCKQDSDEDNFISFMNIISQSIPCKKCREHCVRYMETHKMENYKGLIDNFGNRIGLFKWSVSLHNSVNLRLGKPVVSTADAYMIHDTDIMCQGKCGVD